MLYIEEQEKMLLFDFIVIKPIGFGASMGQNMAQGSSGNMNKGHIINAGILYIMESGLMKVLSTTGAVLLEKNIGFDINPTGIVEDQLMSVISNSNPDDMFVMILTKAGRVYTYPIALEKKFDTSHIMRNLTEDADTAERESPGPDDIVASNFTREERKKLRMAQFQQVQYEYMFQDLEQPEINIDTLLAQKYDGLEGPNEYKDMIYFFAKGKQHAVMVHNSQNLVVLALAKQEVSLLRLAKTEPIQTIQRFSAFVLVQYSRSIDFVLFDKQVVLDTVSRIILTEDILKMQQDVSSQRFLFVQTKHQVILYDCEPLLQEQFTQVQIVQSKIKGCQFVKKLVSDSRADDVIINFKAVQNAVILYFESGKIEILYTRDLLEGIKRGTYNLDQIISQPLIKMQTLTEDDLIMKRNDFSTVSQAKTQLNSMFLHVGQVDNKRALVAT